MATWLLGPLGDLRELETPETGVVITEVRYGGVHQGLNGGRTMDVTGIKTEVIMNFEYLEETDYRWLQALFTRHIPAQHRLVNPMRKNRLTIPAASVNPSPARRRPFYTTTGDTIWVADWPVGPDPGNRSLRWYNRTGTSKALFDGDKTTVVLPLEQVTASVYLKAVVGFDMTLGIDWYDKNLGFISTTTSVSPVTTSWSRVSITATAPAGAAVGRFTLESVSTNEVTIAAPQFESGATATSWDQGGGDLSVLIDQMPANSPRFPIMNCSITLLEA